MSFPPGLAPKAKKRAKQLHRTVSSYVTCLVERDLKNAKALDDPILH